MALKNVFADSLFEQFITQTNVLCDNNYCAVFQRTLQVLLPDLAAKASPAASALIRTLGKQLNVNRREILINNFKYIFSHLVCSCTKDELERALHYLKVFEYLFVFYSFI